MINHHYETELCELIKELNRNGYLPLSNFGSVSLLDRVNSVVYCSPKLGEGFRISDWQLLRPEDVVAVDLQGNRLKEFASVPAIELETHLAIYRTRPQVNAVAHIQPIHVAAFAAAGIDMLPVMVEDVKTMIGGEDGVIHCAPFVRYCSPEYTTAVLATLAPDKKCALLQNNGALCVEANAGELYSICTIVERQAHMEIYATSLGHVEYIDLDMAIDESIRPKRRKNA